MKKTGFTLVELLTVMSIIAILIGILVPALSAVKKVAKDVNQKAQLHSISVGLDMFSGDNQDSYPTSEVKGGSKYTTGAQHLAEAMMGRDMLGFDTKSTWDTEEDDGDKAIYASKKTPLSSSDEEVTGSLARRKGPYLNPGNIDMYNVGQLYTDTKDVYDGFLSSNVPSPVLTDIYRVKDAKKDDGKTAKAGTPILYYKANTSLVDSTTVPIFPNTQIETGGMTLITTISDTQAQSYIYNSMDNEDIIRLGNILAPLVPHHFAYLDPPYKETISGAERDGRWVFYYTITNPNITSRPRPYNADKYLLISAGQDGLYGTKDDITNFGN